MWGDLLGAGNYLNRTYSYTYDDNGNILSVRDDDGDVTTYTYDAQNQLTRENNQAGNFTHTWEYDTAGNILSRSEYDYTTGELGTATNTVTYGYDDSNWGDLLTSYDGDAITYDAIGNPTYSLVDGCYDVYYTWNHGRQLASWEFGDTYMQFTYNADGMRTRATCNSDVYEYVYNGSQLVQMKANSWVGNAVMAFTYDAGGVPQTITYNGTTYYYVTNLQGDVMAILDGTGAAVAQYTYDAWGKVLSTTGYLSDTVGWLNPLRYRGYVYDVNSGLYYLQSRYYDADVGRFINADGYVSTGQGFLSNNMFAYCLNNPTNFVDSHGENSAALQAWSGGMWWLCGADGLYPVGEIIYIAGIIILYVCTEITSDDIAKSQPFMDEGEETTEPVEPEPPDVTYPGDDPTIAPDGYEWRGPDEPGGK